MVSLEETNQTHSSEKSTELVQKAIDKTISLGNHFNGKPTIIVHPGGYSLNQLDNAKILLMKEKLYDSISKLDTSRVNFLLENMPPYGWFFGGRWDSNIFLESSEILSYCKETNSKICFDVCHSQLYCNKVGLSLLDEMKKLEMYISHYHLSDAEGVEGEGLQFGEGDLPFSKVIPLLNKYNDRSFAVEVWKGHEQNGKGFRYFLDNMIRLGLEIK